MQNFAFKFQAVAEKTAKIVRGLLYFAAPCIVYMCKGIRPVKKLGVGLLVVVI